MSISSQIIDLLVKQEAPLVHNTYVITHILNLPQIMGRDDNRHLTLGSILEQQVLHMSAHHRVKTINGLIQNE
ncbi:hypothetical protein D1872_247130 [compost metagenome]